jgi:CheY-like chemotaxis protein
VSNIVMVVDDEADVRLVARIVLSSAGYEVIEADSGESALGALDRGAAPDVLLLDVRMPGIDGWEVLRRLRSDPDRADLPIVIFTAQLTVREDAPVDLGDEHVILKPFQPDELLVAVERATVSRRR